MGLLLPGYGTDSRRLQMLMGATYRDPSGPGWLLDLYSHDGVKVAEGLPVPSAELTPEPLLLDGSWALDGSHTLSGTRI